MVFAARLPHSIPHPTRLVLLPSGLLSSFPRLHPCRYGARGAPLIFMAFRDLQPALHAFPRCRWVSLCISMHWYLAYNGYAEQKIILKQTWLIMWLQSPAAAFRLPSLDESGGNILLLLIIMLPIVSSQVLFERGGMEEWNGSPTH